MQFEGVMARVHGFYFKGGSLLFHPYPTPRRFQSDNVGFLQKLSALVIHKMILGGKISILFLNKDLTIPEVVLKL